MALITCPECGQSVSEHADACPNCGYPINAMIEQKNASEGPNYAYALGCEYSQQQNYEEAAKCFRNAAEQGHALSQFYLGAMYVTGQGVPQSLTDAFTWYLKAAMQGIADAQYSLALLYQEGSGVPQSYCQAFIWYSRAAEQNEPYSQL